MFLITKSDLSVRTALATAAERSSGMMLGVAQRWERKAGRAGWRFVPAPSWPPPPPAWSPRSGWRPDPAWSTPPGWRWMRRKRLPVVLVSGALIVLTVLFGLEIASEANGHSIDPTDPMNYNTYALRNDSTTPQYVHLCADEKCATLDGHLDWVPVRPGSADDEQVYWGWSTPSVFAVALTP
ncbi:MAG: hypothetical protein QOK10_1278, partial [Pseudonocardiales bacterium]|nr:hypothetical protein [Pseudonocardiales bacterium]